MMKNKIYYLGILACILTTCGCTFKVMHWPGAAIILTIGMVMLALLFIPLATSSSCKAEPDKKMKTFYLLAGIVFAVSFISTLFRIMHWPGANTLLMISIPLPFVVLLPAFMLANPVDKEINYMHFMAVMFFFAYFAAITALMALGVSQNLLDGFTRSAYDFEEKTAVLAENIITENNQIAVEANKLCAKIDEIKKELIKNNSGNASKVLNNEQHPDLREIKYRDRRPSIEKHYLTELKADIDNFKVLMQKECSPNSPLYNYLNEAFDLSDSPEGEPWENVFLRDKILITAIERLDLIKFRVQLAANEVVIN
jgi:hypothetical protein